MGDETPKDRLNGFTLIELSIALVIIGLIVGGVLVGRDLIKASEARAQVTQIEKFNQAVNAFRGKYGGLPGDLVLSVANQFGFNTSGCDGAAGHRDGNGLIDGYASPYTLTEAAGETSFFWQDLSSTQLIEGAFPYGGSVYSCASVASITLAPGANYVGNYFPAAKLGPGNFIYVYENNGANWYGLSAVTAVQAASGIMSSTSSIPVLQAFSIDRKMDDGLPTSGNVQAIYINGSQTNTAVPTNSASDTITTCYNTTGPAYSITQNNGAGTNCALSFKMQAGD